MCPAMIFDGDKAHLLMLDANEEKYVKVLDFEKVAIELSTPCNGFRDWMRSRELGNCFFQLHVMDSL